MDFGTLSVTNDLQSKKKEYRDFFVEFDIFNGDSQYIPMHENYNIKYSWNKFLESQMSNVGLSYVSGEKSGIVHKRSKKIYGNAKLISEDEDPKMFPFKFQGRFSSAKQAFSMSYADSCKVDNTIKWLIEKNAFHRYGFFLVIWNTKAVSAHIYSPFDEDDSEELVLSISQSYAEQIHRKIMGLQRRVEYQGESSIVLAQLEIATKARMSITYYEELGGETYLRLLERWYLSCWWRLSSFDSKTQSRSVGNRTPTPYEVGTAIFGTDKMREARSDKDNDYEKKPVTRLVRRFYNDILICIVNGRPVPLSYTMAACRRVYQSNTFTDQKGSWQRFDWENCMAVTLAMLKSSYPKEDYNVSLNTECKDRSYLFGRLAAVADVVEQRATDFDKHETNAVRFFSAMQQKPSVTWAILDLKLKPYFSKLNKYYEQLYRNLIDEIYNQADFGDMSNNTSLSPKFLEGYHNQRYELNKKKEN